MSGSSYVSSTGSKSIKEHMIRCMGVMDHVCPEDMHPTSIYPVGDVRMHLLYVLYPHLRPQSNLSPSCVATSNRLTDGHLHHTRSGFIIQKKQLPVQLREDLTALKYSLLPETTWQEMGKCNNPQSLIDVIQMNAHFFRYFTS